MIDTKRLVLHTKTNLSIVQQKIILKQRSKRLKLYKEILFEVDDDDTTIDTQTIRRKFLLNHQKKRRISSLTIIQLIK